MAVAMAVAAILVVVAAARPVYMAVLSLSLPVIVAAARTMLVTVLSLRVRVAVLVLGLRHGRAPVSPWVPKPNLHARKGTTIKDRLNSRMRVKSRVIGKPTIFVFSPRLNRPDIAASAEVLLAPTSQPSPQFPFPPPAHHLHGCACVSGS